MLEGIRTCTPTAPGPTPASSIRPTQLTPEQFTTSGDGFGSIRDTLVHTASAQWLWLERWRGTSPTRAVGPG